VTTNPHTLGDLMSIGNRMCTLLQRHGDKFPWPDNILASVAVLEWTKMVLALPPSPLPELAPVSPPAVATNGQHTAPDATAGLMPNALERLKAATKADEVCPDCGHALGPWEPVTTPDGIAIPGRFTRQCDGPGLHLQRRDDRPEPRDLPPRDDPDYINQTREEMRLTSDPFTKAAYTPPREALDTTG